MSYGVLDHPVIRNMELTGHPEGREPEYPCCPMCNSETDVFYKTVGAEIVGCDNCIRAVNAWDETA